MSSCRRHVLAIGISVVGTFSSCSTTSCTVGDAFLTTLFAGVWHILHLVSRITVQRDALGMKPCLSDKTYPSVRSFQHPIDGDAPNKSDTAWPPERHGGPVPKRRPIPRGSVPRRPHLMAPRPRVQVLHHRLVDLPPLRPGRGRYPGWRAEHPLRVPEPESQQPHRLLRAVPPRLAGRQRAHRVPLLRVPGRGPTGGRACVPRAVAAGETCGQDAFRLRCRSGQEAVGGIFEAGKGEAGGYRSESDGGSAGRAEEGGTVLFV